MNLEHIDLKLRNRNIKVAETLEDKLGASPEESATAAHLTSTASMSLLAFAEGRTLLGYCFGACSVLQAIRMIGVGRYAEETDMRKFIRVASNYLGNISGAVAISFIGLYLIDSEQNFTREVVETGLFALALKSYSTGDYLDKI